MSEDNGYGYENPLWKFYMLHKGDKPSVHIVQQMTPAHAEKLNQESQQKGDGFRWVEYTPDESDVY